MDTYNGKQLALAAGYAFAIGVNLGIAVIIILATRLGWW